MALGGGTWLTQNKKLPGTYHNFISKARAFVNLADRGYIALPDIFDWYKDGVTTVTAAAFESDSLSLFGYDYTSDKINSIKDIFKNAHTLFIHAINEGGKAAENQMAVATHKGVRGNDLTITVQASVDAPGAYIVQTMFGPSLVDEQTVTDVTELKDNAFVKFKAVPLEATAGMPLVGGDNGTEPTGTPWQKALDNFEAYGFNALICPSDIKSIKDLFVAYTKRLRDSVGAKFQLIGHDLGAVDHEGVIDVHNKAVGGTYELVYWTGGAAGGCAINKSNTNKVYTGNWEVDLDGATTQLELENLLTASKFVFHRVGEETRVLEDINTFTSHTVDKNEDFQMNQVIRVLDQIAIDTAHLFNKRYLGLVPNDDDGRISLRNDIMAHRKEMQRIRALQNYNADLLIVEQGASKKAVVMTEEVQPTVAMSQLYVTTTVA